MVRKKEGNKSNYLFIFVSIGIVILLFLIILYTKKVSVEKAPSPPTFEEFYGFANCENGVNLNRVELSANVSNGTYVSRYNTTIIGNKYSLLIYGVSKTSSITFYIGNNPVGSSTYNPFYTINKNFTQPTGQTGCPAINPSSTDTNGYLSVTAGVQNPAVLNIDGRNVGSTPLVFGPISQGTHTVRVTKLGYYDYYNDLVPINGGETTRITVKLYSNGAVADTSAPIISGVEPTSVTTNSAVITWITDEPSDSLVEFGETSIYGYKSTYDSTSVYSHAVPISGLSSGVTYHFRTRSRDLAGNVAYSDDYSFTTVDVAPPVISNIYVEGITSSFAQISWNTNEPSTSQIQYGLTTTYGLTTNLDNNLLLFHNQSISGLGNNKLYHFRVISEDAQGNIQYSADNTFKTAAGRKKSPSLSPQSENIFYIILLLVFVCIALIFYSFSKKVKTVNKKRKR